MQVRAYAHLEKVKCRGNFSCSLGQLDLLLLLRYMRCFCDRTVLTREPRRVVCELLAMDLPVKL